MKHKAEAKGIAERICKEERNYTSMTASELQTFFDNCKSKFDGTDTNSMDEAFYEGVCNVIACESFFFVFFFSVFFACYLPPLLSCLCFTSMSCCFYLGSFFSLTFL